MPDVSQGHTIVFGTSGFSANIVDITYPPAQREALDTTHQGTTDAMTSMPADLPNWGPMVFGIQFDAGTDPPIGSAEETVTITAPDASTWVFTGYMSNYAPDAPRGQVMTGSVTVEVDGDIAIT